MTFIHAIFIASQNAIIIEEKQMTMYPQVLQNAKRALSEEGIINKLAGPIPRTPSNAKRKDTPTMPNKHIKSSLFIKTIPNPINKHGNNKDNDNPPS
jgi:hypothetical protein